MKTNYVIIGDSITYGIGDLESGGWATMFKNYMMNKENSKECMNYVHLASFPGATSTEILNKIEYILPSFSHQEFTNKIILSIGVNDTQEFNGSQKNSVEHYKQNMKKIIKHVIEKEFNITILGLTRIASDKKFFWKPNKYFDNKIISEYDQNLFFMLKNDSELKEFYHHIQYIPMKDVLQKDDFIDGLHPNHSGHKKILKKVIHHISI